MKRSSCYVFLAVLTGTALLMGGCRTRPRRSGPEQQILSRSIELEKLREVITKNYGRLEALKGLVNVVIDDPGEGKYSLSGAIAIKPPDKIRLIVRTTVSATYGFTALSDGKDYWVIVPAMRQVFTGPFELQPSGQQREVRFRPSDVVVAFYPQDVAVAMGFPKIVFRESTSRAYIVYVLRVDPQSQGGPRLFSKTWIERQNFTIVRRQLFNQDGALRLDASFGEYAKVEEISIPTRMAFHWPATGTTLSILLHDLEVNGRLSNSTFKFEKPAGYDIQYVEPGGFAP